MSIHTLQILLVLVATFACHNSLVSGDCLVPKEEINQKRYQNETTKVGVTCGRASKTRSLLHHQEPTRIFNGNDIKPGVFPSYFKLDIRFKDKIRHCSGALIDIDLILTAGHCLMGDVQAIEAVHMTDGKFKVKKWCQSRKLYSVHHSKSAYDIGLLKLDKKLKFSTNLQPACLMDRVLDNDQPCFSVGNGIINPNKEKPKVPQYFIAKKIECFPADRHPTVMCMFSQKAKSDYCQGDSGGPTYAVYDGRQYVVTIHSAGGFLKDCTESRWAPSGTLRADVFALRNEINEMINECK